jgi:hypothetical protein
MLLSIILISCTNSQITVSFTAPTDPSTISSRRMVSPKETLFPGLSPALACLVIHQILRPVNEMLHSRAHARRANHHFGDDGCGSKSAAYAYFDDREGPPEPAVPQVRKCDISGGTNI